MSANVCVRSGFTRCVIARFICGAISHVMLLRDFSCGASHALCHCETFLRSDFTHCAVARFICVAVSRFVSLRDLFAERFQALCRCETFLA